MQEPFFFYICWFNRPFCSGITEIQAFGLSAGQRSTTTNSLDYISVQYHSRCFTTTLHWSTILSAAIIVMCSLRMATSDTEAKYQHVSVRVLKCWNIFSGDFNFSFQCCPGLTKIELRLNYTNLLCFCSSFRAFLVGHFNIWFWFVICKKRCCRQLMLRQISK